MNFQGPNVATWDAFEIVGTPETTWTFHCPPSPDPYLARFGCHIKKAGYSAWGYGHSVWPKKAINIALYEAWERLNFHLHGSSPSSNGWAAGQTEHSAKVAAKQELIERRVVLRAWEEKCGWVPYQLTHWQTKLWKCHPIFRNWALQYFEIRAENHRIIVGLATHPALGAFFDSVYRESSFSDVKLITSLLRGILRRESFDMSIAIQENSPSHREVFYTNPAHLAAFDFLKSRTSALPLDEDWDISRIQTKIITKSGPFPAVAQANHPTWSELDWTYPKGTTQWPHPIM